MKIGLVEGACSSLYFYAFLSQNLEEMFYITVIIFIRLDILSPGPPPSKILSHFMEIYYEVWTN